MDDLVVLFLLMCIFPLFLMIGMVALIVLTVGAIIAVFFELFYICQEIVRQRRAEHSKPSPEGPSRFPGGPHTSQVHPPEAEGRELESQPREGPVRLAGDSSTSEVDLP